MLVRVIIYSEVNTLGVRAIDETVLSLQVRVLLCVLGRIFECCLDPRPPILLLRRLSTSQYFRAKLGRLL